MNRVGDRVYLQKWNGFIQEVDEVGGECKVELDDGIVMNVKKFLNISAKMRNGFDDFLAKGTKTALLRTLKDADRTYYDNHKGLSVPDSVYDKIFSSFGSRFPDHPYLQNREHDIQFTKSKVELPFYMSSLDNIKPDDSTAEKWLQSHPGPYMVMDKADGISMAISFVNGEAYAYTKYSTGGGRYGLDVSRLLPHLRLPDVDEDMDIRVELEMREDVFLEKYQDKKANARNMVSGIVGRLKGIDEAIQDVDVIAYSIVKPKMKKSAQLRKLKALGFKVVPHKRFDTLDVPPLLRVLQTRKKKSAYAIDGLVIEQDKLNTPPESGNPDYSKAFKAINDDDIHTVEVLDVEWNPSQYGKLIPRLTIEPTYIGGVTVSHAAGKNAKYIVDNGIGPGAKIRVIRSGDVIPDVLNVVEPVKVKLPEEEFVWTDSGVDIQLVDTNIQPIVAKKIAQFFITLGVEDLGLRRIGQLMEVGMNDVLSIVNATVDDFMQVEGIQKRMAAKLRKNIDSVLVDVDKATFMAASGVFGEDVKVKRISAVLNKFPDILDRDAETIFNLAMDVDGIGDVLARKIADGAKDFNAFVSSLDVTFAEKKSGCLDNHVIVMTGFRDKELAKAISDNGGEAGGSVTRKTTLLLALNANGTSGKIGKAKKMGVDVMTPESFKERFNLE